MTTTGIIGSLVKAAILCLTLTSSANAYDRLTNHPELETIFRAHGVTGTFVLFDVTRDHLHVFDENRAKRPFVPASTFKIANSLIALETGAVRDENEIVPVANETEKTISRKKSMSMRDAIKVSNVPVYQTLARRVGLSTYLELLDTLNYGNGLPGNDVETFWLKGPLKISPMAQVAFLADLARGDLNLSDRTQDIVRDILFIEQSDGARLYAKTGWSIASTPGIGWWVGWVEREEQVYAFALNIDMPSSRDVKKRVPLAKALLAEMGVY